MNLELNSLKDGDVIVLRGSFDDSIIEPIIKTVKGTGKKNVTVFLLTEGQTLETMDDDQMREAGWVRAYKSQTITV